MHTVFALLCFVLVIHWLIFPYPPGFLHWHCGNLTIAPVPAKQPWWIWINTSCEFIMKDCITTTKQSTTKPCAYFLGYTVSFTSAIVMTIKCTISQVQDYTEAFANWYRSQFLFIVLHTLTTGSASCHHIESLLLENVYLIWCDCYRWWVETMAWLCNYIRVKEWYITTYPCLNFSDGLTKLTLRLVNVLINTSKRTMVIITYPCPNPR